MKKITSLVLLFAELLFTVPFTLLGGIFLGMSSLLRCAFDFIRSCIR